MADDIINFEAAKQRRRDAEGDADEAQWWETHRALVEVLVGSGRSVETSLITITLRALIDVLLEQGVGIDEAKAHIARTLAVFR